MESVLWKSHLLSSCQLCLGVPLLYVWLKLTVKKETCMASFLALMAKSFNRLFLVALKSCVFWTAALALSLRYKRPLLFFKQITFESNQSSSFSTHPFPPWQTTHGNHPTSPCFRGRLHFTSREPDDKRPHRPAGAGMRSVWSRSGRGGGGLTCLHLSKVTFRGRVCDSQSTSASMRGVVGRMVPQRSNLTPSRAPRLMGLCTPLTAAQRDS